MVKCYPVQSPIFSWLFADIPHIIGYQIVLFAVHHYFKLRPRQNGRHFADDTLKCIFLNENVWIPVEISLKFVPKRPIDNIPALVYIMAWRRPGDKPLSEPMMVRLPTHICVARSQWDIYHCSVFVTPSLDRCTVLFTQANTMSSADSQVSINVCSSKRYLSTEQVCLNTLCFIF